MFIRMLGIAATQITALPGWGTCTQGPPASQIPFVPRPALLINGAEGVEYGPPTSGVGDIGG